MFDIGRHVDKSQLLIQFPKEIRRRIREVAKTLLAFIEIGLNFFPFRDVLTDSDHPHDISFGIAPGGGIEQHVHPPALLGEEGKFEILGLLALKRPVEHVFDGGLVVLADELGYQIVAHRLLLGKAGDFRGALIPLVDPPLGVDAEDGSVGRIDQSGQVIQDRFRSQFRQLALRNILQRAYQFGGFASGIHNPFDLSINMANRAIRGHDPEIGLHYFAMFEGSVYGREHKFFVLGMNNVRKDFFIRFNLMGFPSENTERFIRPHLLSGFEIPLNVTKMGHLLGFEHRIPALSQAGFNFLHLKPANQTLSLVGRKEECNEEPGRQHRPMLPRMFNREGSLGRSDHNLPFPVRDPDGFDDGDGKFQRLRTLGGSVLGI